MVTATTTVFLDFDGVLLPFGPQDVDVGPRLTRPATPSCIEALNCILESRPCEIVLSTNWRRSVPLPLLARLLRTWGVEAADVVGETRFIPGPIGRTRWLEIASWIVEHLGPRRSVLILDDVQWMSTLEAFHVCPRSDVGLTLEHCGAALAIIDRRVA